MTEGSPTAARPSPDTRPRRRLHFLWDQTERLFSQGQARFEVHDFDAAIALLRRAAARDPAYARIQCWLGMALAESGCTDAADEAFERALQLRRERTDHPARGLACFHLERGLAQLDAGRAEGARTHIAAALECDPQNHLVRAGGVLVDWDLRKQRAAEVLLGDFEIRPRRHQARVIVRLAQWALAGGRPSAVTPPRSRPGAVERLATRVERRRTERQLATAERLLAGEPRRCLEMLGGVRAETRDERRLHRRLFDEATRAVVDGLKVQLAAADPAAASRRVLLLEAGAKLSSLGRHAEAAELAREWLAGFDEAGRPGKQLFGALDALGWLAGEAVARRDFERALDVTAEGLALFPRDTGEVRRLRALAHVGLLDLRAARHEFETWIASFHLTAEDALRSVIV